MDYHDQPINASSDVPVRIEANWARSISSGRHSVFTLVTITLLMFVRDVGAQDPRSQAKDALIPLLGKCLTLQANYLGEKNKTIDVKIEDDVLLVVVDSKDQMNGYKIPLKEIDRVYRPFANVLGCRNGACITEISHWKIMAKPSTEMHDAWGGPSCLGMDIKDTDGAQKDADALDAALRRLVDSYRN